MKKKNLVVANWKMNPTSLEEAKQIFNAVRNEAKKLRSTEIIICPPFPFIQPLKKLIAPKNIFFGAQNTSSEEKGAFTGEVSGAMLNDVGVRYVLVGHSERRAMGETNEQIKKKLEMAFLSKLTPILCIGEKVRDKDGGHLEFLKNQIKECLTGLEKKNTLGLTIAYEPVWAIGKSYSEAMSPTDIHETTLYIKKVAGELFGKDMADSWRILYGAAVEAENAPSIMEYGNVSGFLVGHMSLVPEKFTKILKAAEYKK